MHLIARKPMPGFARLRFVSTASNWLSMLIRFRTMADVSHVEAVLPDGTVIGAYFDGVKQMPGDYNGGYTSQRFVDILMPQESIDHWTNYLKSRVGREYDWDAIAGIALHLNLHKPRGLICSMLAALSLRESGVFRRPLSEPAHEITPRDLLLVLSAHPAAKVGQTESLTP